MKRVFAIFVFAALLGGGFAWAQETTGSVIGVITSEDGATMPGVTVTIADPDTGFERTTVTSTAGEFRFVALPPATYALQAALDGFQTYKRNIAVSLGRTVKNDFTMSLGAVTDVIEVTGEAPMVDVTSTVAGLTVSTDEINNRVPIGREATQIAMLAPASVASDSAFTGNSAQATKMYTPGQQVVSISGNSVAENSYQVNGLNLTNFRNGLGSSFVPFEFMEEVQVKTGGYEAEFGRATGGVINMVTKSGSNSFRGGVNAYYQPESLQEMKDDNVYYPNHAGESEELEANASIGGAIIKDKLFYFAFIDYTDRSDWWMEDGRGTLNEQATPYYGGKLDWNITPNFRLEGTYFTDETTVDTTAVEYDRTTDTFGAEIGIGEIQRGGENYIGKFTGILAENFLISLQYGKNDFDRTDASSGDSFPAVYDGRGGDLIPVGYWVNFQASEAADSREAMRADADWFLGNHSLRAGIDDETNTSSDNTFYSGHEYWRYYNNGTRFPQLPADAVIVRLRHYESGGEYETLTNAIYAQDSWAVTPSLTVNAGIRWEVFDNKNALGDSYIKVDDQYAPRVGAIWDPSGNGRSKLYASYGLYHLPIASNTNIRQAGMEFFDEAFYEVDWSGTGNPYNPDGTPVALGQLLSSTLISDGEVPDSRETKSNSIDPSSQWELILGYEQMVGSNWSVGARFINREFGKVIEDITIDQQLWAIYGVDCYNPDSPDFGSCAHEYRLTNPGEDFEGWYDLNGDGELDPISWTAAEGLYQEPVRKYYAVELTANRRFADNWMLMASYTWSQSYGNYEGYVNSDIGQDDAGITQSFDFAGLQDGDYGFLPNDRRHNVKVFGAYAFDFGLQVGANAWYRTGRPINAYGLHPTDPWAVQYGVFSHFNQGVACPRGCMGTTDDTYALDLNVKYDFTLAGLNMNVRADVFNVLNNQHVTQVVESAEQTTGAPQENFLEPTDTQAARRVRLGVGLTF
jgi:outer membrane receptor protein involved in Fe transport